MTLILKESKVAELPSELIDDMVFFGLFKVGEKGELMLDSFCFTENDINYVKNNANNAEINSICVEVVHFLNQQAKTRYRVNVAATQRLIKARVKEGFTLDDFKTVISSKCKEWGNDPKMKKYIRPATLFAPTNFESYLNHAEPYREESKREERREQAEQPILYDIDMDW